MNKYRVVVYDYTVSVDEMLDIIEANLYAEVEVNGRDIILTMEAEGYYDIEAAMHYVTESPKIGEYVCELLED